MTKSPQKNVAGPEDRVRYRPHTGRTRINACMTKLLRPASLFLLVGSYLYLHRNVHVAMQFILSTWDLYRGELSLEIWMVFNCTELLIITEILLIGNKIAKCTNTLISCVSKLPCVSSWFTDRQLILFYKTVVEFSSNCTGIWLAVFTVLIKIVYLIWKGWFRDISSWN